MTRPEPGGGHPQDGLWAGAREGRVRRRHWAGGRRTASRRASGEEASVSAATVGRWAMSLSPRSGPAALGGVGNHRRARRRIRRPWRRTPSAHALPDDRGGGSADLHRFVCDREGPPARYSSGDPRCPAEELLQIAHWAGGWRSDCATSRTSCFDIEATRRELETASREDGGGARAAEARLAHVNRTTRTEADDGNQRRGLGRPPPSLSGGKGSDGSGVRGPRSASDGCDPTLVRDLGRRCATSQSAVRTTW